MDRHVTAGHRTLAPAGERPGLESSSGWSPPSPHPPRPPPPPPPPPPPSSPPYSRVRLRVVETWHPISSEAHGGYYFCNPATGETTWERPDPARSRVMFGFPMQQRDTAARDGCARGSTPSRTGLVTSEGAKLSGHEAASDTRVSSFDGRPEETHIEGDPRSKTAHGEACATPANSHRPAFRRSRSAMIRPAEDGLGGRHVRSKFMHDLHPANEKQASAVDRRNRVHAWQTHDDPGRVSIAAVAHSAHFSRRASTGAIKNLKPAPLSRKNSAGTVHDHEEPRATISRHASLEVDNAGHRPRTAGLRNNWTQCRSLQDERTTPSLCSQYDVHLVGSGVSDVILSSVTEPLLRAEDWLARNDPAEEGQPRQPKCDTTVGNHHRIVANGACVTASFVDQGNAPEVIGSDIFGDEEKSEVFAVPLSSEIKLGTERRTGAGRAAAELAAYDAWRKEDREMTGKPKITRLGRSKQRSIDDLFLYRRNADAARRKKQLEVDAMEDKLLTGRPETCHRSKLIVKRMRRENGKGIRNGYRLAASERLYKVAWQQQQRRIDRQIQVNAAARLNANPNLTSNSGSNNNLYSTTATAQSHHRCDVGERLYEQAMIHRQNALDRARIAQSSPRDATFHPEISRRSVSLARRRRQYWRESGSEESGRGGGGLVEEGLLTEGKLYDRRRHERQIRQAELDDFLRRGYRANQQSEIILQDAEVPRATLAERGRAQGGSGRGDAGRMKQNRSGGGPPVISDFADELRIDDVEEATFKPALAALKTSNKLLESRYGHDSIPTMEQRSVAWVRERIARVRSTEGRRRKGERAGRVMLTSSSCRRSSERHRKSAYVLGKDGSGRAMYERAIEYARLSEGRRIAERAARREEEMAGCTFAPTLLTRLERGKRKSNNSSARHTTSRGNAEVHQDPGEYDSSSNVDNSIMSSSNQSALASAPSDRLTDNLVATGHQSLHSNGERRRQERGQPHENDRHVDESRFRQRQWQRRPALPDGWSFFFASEGRPYFFNAMTGAVQWQRPVRCI